MRKIFPLIVLLCTLLIRANANNYDVDKTAKAIAEKIIKSHLRNASLNNISDKKHVIDISGETIRQSNPAQRYNESYVNGGGGFWNLSAGDKTEIDNHINSFTNTSFSGIDYFIIIGSVYNYADINSDAEDLDWADLQKKKKIANGFDKKDEKKYFDAVKDKVEAILDLTFPEKYILNWYLTVFTEGENGNFSVKTKTYIRNRSGISSPNFGFQGSDAAFNATAVDMSKKDWVKKNVDIDANTIKYLKQFETSYLVNKTNRTITSDEALRKLFNGESNYNENGIVYRNLKLIVLLSEDGVTSNEDRVVMAKLQSTSHTIIWLNFSTDGKLAIQKGYPKFPANGLGSQTEELIKRLFYERTTDFWERFGGELGNYGNEFAVFLYDAMDFLSKGIEHAVIPEKVWNCCKADYNPQYASIFGYILSPISKILEEASGNTLGNISTATCTNATVSKAQFAMYVGVWNGFVTIVKVIPDGIKLLVSAGIRKESQPVDPSTGNATRNDMALFKAKVHENDPNSFILGLFKMIGSTLKELHDPNMPCLLAHSLGSDALIIAAAFFTGGESLAGSTISNLTRQVFITLQRLDIVGQTIGLIGGTAAKYTIVPLLTPVANVVKQSLSIAWKEVSTGTVAAFEIIIENGAVVIKVFNASVNALRDFEWSFAKQAQVIIRKADGSLGYIKIGFPNASLNGLAKDLVDLKKEIILEIRDVIKDKNGSALVNEKGQGVAVIKDAETGNELLAVVDDAEDVGNGNIKKYENFLDAQGKFVDRELESDYSKYLARKGPQGNPRGRLDWKEARDYWLFDSPMARGNFFNKKAVDNSWYDYNEVTLQNGKRLDGYTPPGNGKLGQIVSRKATNLEEIELATFEKYLQEIKTKYPAGEPINAPKYGDELKGKVLEGEQILEIPESNQSFSQIQEYIDLAKNKYGIKINFKPE